MPYINRKRRIPIVNNLLPTLNQIQKEILNGSFQKGDLNFIITMLVHRYCKTKGVSYSTCSDITGVLNDVKVEFERRVVAPYENVKIEENGDIYSDLDMEEKRNEEIQDDLDNEIDSH